MARDRTAYEMLVSANHRRVVLLERTQALLIDALWMLGSKIDKEDTPQDVQKWSVTARKLLDQIETHLESPGQKVEGEDARETTCEVVAGGGVPEVGGGEGPGVEERGDESLAN